MFSSVRNATVSEWCSQVYRVSGRGLSYETATTTSRESVGYALVIAIGRVSSTEARRLSGLVVGLMHLAPGRHMGWPLVERVRWIHDSSGTRAMGGASSGLPLSSCLQQRRCSGGCGSTLASVAAIAARGLFVRFQQERRC